MVNVFMELHAIDDETYQKVKPATKQIDENSFTAIYLACDPKTKFGKIQANNTELDKVCGSGLWDAKGQRMIPAGADGSIWIGSVWLIDLRRKDRAVAAVSAVYTGNSLQAKELTTPGLDATCAVVDLTDGRSLMLRFPVETSAQAAEAQIFAHCMQIFVNEVRRESGGSQRSPESA
eukprot:g28817.t1